MENSWPGASTPRANFRFTQALNVKIEIYLKSQFKTNILILIPDFHGWRACYSEGHDRKKWTVDDTR